MSVSVSNELRVKLQKEYQKRFKDGLSAQFFKGGDVDLMFSEKFVEFLSVVLHANESGCP